MTLADGKLTLSMYFLFCNLSQDQTSVVNIFMFWPIWKHLISCFYLSSFPRHKNCRRRWIVSGQEFYFSITQKNHVLGEQKKKWSCGNWFHPIITAWFCKKCFLWCETNMLSQLRCWHCYYSVTKGKFNKTINCFFKKSIYTYFWYAHLARNSVLTQICINIQSQNNGKNQTLQ